MVCLVVVTTAASLSAAAGSAFAWTTPLIISPANVPEASVPHVAPGFGGKVFAVWQTKDWYLRFRERSATGTWSSVSVLNTAFSAGAVVAEDNQGRPNIVFMERNANTTMDLVHLYRNSSGNWIRTSCATTTDYDEDWPLMDADAAGKLHVVYTKVVPGDGGGNIHYRQYSNGVWSGETTIGHTDAVVYRGPRMQVDATGVVHVCWIDTGGDRYIVQYRRFNGSGWSAALTIGQSVNQSFVSGPRMAAADSSTIVATWNRETCTNGCNVTDYTASTNGGATWSAVQNRAAIYPGNLYGRGGRVFFAGHDTDRTRVMLYTWSNGTWDVGVRVNPGESYWKGWADVTQTVEGNIHVVYDDVVDASNTHQIAYAMQASTSPTGTLTGRVLEQGNALPGASVVSSSGGEAITAADGTYNLACPAGTVTLRANKAGYTQAEVTGVVMNTGQTTLLSDISLTALPVNPVTNVAVTGYVGRNGLSWKNPSSPGYASTTIRYRTDDYPTGPSDGLLAGEASGVPDGAGSFLHTGLSGSKTYYYALFASNGRPVATYSAGATTSCLPYSTADFDLDHDVDLSDFALFQMCFNGPNRPPAMPVSCGSTDLDADGDVDLADFAMFQACFNGPNRPPAEGCAHDADFDGNADLDLRDFMVFQGCFNGPNQPAACS